MYTSPLLKETYHNINDLFNLNCIITCCLLLMPFFEAIKVGFSTKLTTLIMHAPIRYQGQKRPRGLVAQRQCIWLCSENMFSFIK